MVDIFNERVACFQPRAQDNFLYELCSITAYVIICISYGLRFYGIRISDCEKENMEPAKH